MSQPQTLDSKPAQPKRSLSELDTLRVVGMGLILYEHARPYLGWDPRFRGLLPDFGGIGLTIFFLLSGFLLRRSQQLRISTFHPVVFLKSRLVRILPLYWLAIATFTLVFHYGQLFRPLDFSPLGQTLLFHLLGLQLFFTPHSYIIFTLWYMGALIPFYAAFAVTARFSIRKYLLVNGLVLLGLYTLKLLLGKGGIEILDTRLLIHFPSFLLGAYYMHLDSDCHWIRSYSRRLAVVCMVLLLLSVQWQGGGGFPINPVRIVPANFVYYAHCMLGAIAFIAVAFELSRFTHKASALMTLLSASSYAVYLFHRPLYSLFYTAVLTLWSSSVIARTVLFPAATLLVLIVSYGLTQFDKRWVKPTFTKRLDLRATAFVSWLTRQKL